MTETFLYAFLSVVLVSTISLVGIFTLSLRENVLKKYLFFLVSLAIGALLGDTFIHLLPETFEELNPSTAGLLVIFGILLFFILEKFLHWHHSHGTEEECHPENSSETEETKIRPVGRIVLISDGVHNFLDGIIIGVSYLISIPVGIATTLAVILHEIPQEIGDFGVLLHAGYTKSRALLLNFLSALVALGGLFFALALGENAEHLALFAVPIAAGSFLYIAASDLIPELHKTKVGVGNTIIQIGAILLGVLAMWLLLFLE